MKQAEKKTICHPQEAYNLIKEKTNTGTITNKQTFSKLYGQAVRVGMLRI